MNKIMVSGLILLSLSVNCACREKEPGPQVLTLRGHFAAVGSAPFVKLAFRAENGLTYEVAPGEARALFPLQGRPVEIRGAVKTAKLTTVDGRYTRRVLTLEQIEIIREFK
jgi:hypothetical protein